jgi:hypothetical protein
VKGKWGRGNIRFFFFFSYFQFPSRLRPKEEPVPSSRDKLNTRTNKSKI